MTRQSLIHEGRSAILAPLALLGVALCGVVGCGSQVTPAAASPPPGSVAVSPVSLPDCPSAPLKAGTYTAGPANVMVPASPSAARVCRYSGLNQPTPAGSLVKAGDVNSAELPSLVKALNAAVPMPMRINCPNDDNSSDLVMFGYSNGHTVNVTVGLRGCNVVRNGADVKHLTSTPTLGQLASVVGAPSGPGQPGN